MSNEVRTALAEDAPRLADIDALVSASPCSAQQFATTCSSAGLESPDTTWVLELEGVLVGFVVLSRVLDEVSIHDIAVHPAQQGKGLGYALLEAALARMKSSGAQRCLLEVRRSNSRARRLYQSSDFRVDGVRKNYYPAQDGREDALLMSRQL